MTGCSLKASNRKYSDALSAYEAGKYEEATELFLEAIEKNPDKAEFYLDYGFTLIKLGRYEEAIEQFERVILDKDIEMIRENNKKAYRGIGIVYYSSGRYEEAIEQFDLALTYSELQEINVDILSYKGNALEMSGKLEEALLVYEELLEQGNEMAGLYRTRADIFRKQGEYEKSLADYERALKIGDGDFHILLGKFAVLKELKRDQEAKEALMKAEELKIVTDADLFDLAQVHFYQENFDSAKHELKQCLENGFAEANYFLGEIYLKEKEYEQAYQSFLAYIESGKPATAALYNQLLVCSLVLEEYEAAGEYLEHAKAFSDPLIRQSLARNEIIYLEHTGDFKTALDKLERYLVLFPEDTQAQEDLIFLQTRVVEETEE